MTVITSGHPSADLQLGETLFIRSPVKNLNRELFAVPFTQHCCPQGVIECLPRQPLNLWQHGSQGPSQSKGAVGPIYSQDCTDVAARGAPYEGPEPCEWCKTSLLYYVRP